MCKAYLTYKTHRDRVGVLRKLVLPVGKLRHRGADHFSKIWQTRGGGAWGWGPWSQLQSWPVEEQSLLWGAGGACVWVCGQAGWRRRPISPDGRCGGAVGQGHVALALPSLPLPLSLPPTAPRSASSSSRTGRARRAWPSGTCSSMMTRNRSW